MLLSSVSLALLHILWEYPANTLVFSFCAQALYGIGPPSLPPPALSLSLSECMCVSLCRSVCVSLSLSLCVCVSLSLSECVSLSLSLCVSFFLLLFNSVTPSLPPSLSLSLPPSLSPSLSLSLSLSLFNSIQYVLYWHGNCYNVLPKHSVYVESRTDIYIYIKKNLRNE